MALCEGFTKATGLPCINRWTMMVEYLEEYCDRPNVKVCKRHLNKSLIEKSGTNYFRVYSFGKGQPRGVRVFDSYLPEDVLERERADRFDATHCAICKHELRGCLRVACGCYKHNVCSKCFKTHVLNSFERDGFDGRIRCPMVNECSKHFDETAIVHALPKFVLRSYQSRLCEFPPSRVQNILDKLFYAETYNAETYNAEMNQHYSTDSDLH